MKISERTVTALGSVVTGDGKKSPYNSGPKLVRFFNELGSNDVYAPGFPSRWEYAEKRIRSLNNSPKLVEVLTRILDPRRFIDSEYDVREAVEYLNQYLRFDGYELVAVGDSYKVKEMAGNLIEIDIPFKDFQKDSHLFIDEQIKKCDKKIVEGDFGGAITNARSLLEAVLIEIERKLDPDAKAYDGDLPKLFRRVRAELLKEETDENVSGMLKQVLGGLSSIVHGLASMRNVMSDAHAAGYKPEKRHAKLAVNASKTVSDFIVELYQLRSPD